MAHIVIPKLYISLQKPPSLLRCTSGAIVPMDLHGRLSFTHRRRTNARKPIASSYLCSRDSAASFSTFGSSKVATISSESRSLFLRAKEAELYTVSRARYEGEEREAKYSRLTDEFEARQFPRAPFGDYDARRANVSVQHFVRSVKEKQSLGDLQRTGRKNRILERRILV